jgi:hypothetical protein
MCYGLQCKERPVGVEDLVEQVVMRSFYGSRETFRF